MAKIQINPGQLSKILQQFYEGTYRYKNDIPRAISNMRDNIISSKLDRELLERQVEFAEKYEYAEDYLKLIEDEKLKLRFFPVKVGSGEGMHAGFTLEFNGNREAHNMTEVFADEIKLNILIERIVAKFFSETFDLPEKLFAFKIWPNTYQSVNCDNNENLGYLFEGETSTDITNKLYSLHRARNKINELAYSSEVLKKALFCDGTIKDLQNLYPKLDNQMAVEKAAKALDLRNLNLKYILDCAARKLEEVRATKVEEEKRARAISRLGR